MLIERDKQIYSLSQQLQTSNELVISLQSQLDKQQQVPLFDIIKFTFLGTPRKAATRHPTIRSSQLYSKTNNLN